MKKEQLVKELINTPIGKLEQEHLEGYVNLIGRMSREGKIALLGFPTYMKMVRVMSERWENILESWERTGEDQQLPNGMWMKERPRLNKALHEKWEEIVPLDSSIAHCGAVLKAALGVDLGNLVKLAIEAEEGKRELKRQCNVPEEELPF